MRCNTQKRSPNVSDCADRQRIPKCRCRRFSPTARGRSVPCGALLPSPGVQRRGHDIHEPTSGLLLCICRRKYRRLAHTPGHLVQRISAGFWDYYSSIIRHCQRYFSRFHQSPVSVSPAYPSALAPSQTRPFPSDRRLLPLPLQRMLPARIRYLPPW